jgi:hypothetical protein
LQKKKKVVSCHTADSKPVKEEVNSTVILPPLVFPGQSMKSLSWLVFAFSGSAGFARSCSVPSDAGCVTIDHRELQRRVRIDGFDVGSVDVRGGADAGRKSCPGEAAFGRKASSKGEGRGRSETCFIFVGVAQLPMQ